MADPRLRIVARYAEAGGDSHQPICSVVLHVNGTLISGDVVSEKEHVRKTIEIVQDSIPTGLAAKLTYDGLSAEHIYLSGVTCLTNNTPQKLPLLAVELSAVDAWTFGALAT
jgi:hypothetical protein